MGIKSKNQSATVQHLVGVYVARRELVPVLKRELLAGEREITLEEASILLDLFLSQMDDRPALSLDHQGFSTLKQIEEAQMLSQPQIHRRVGQLLRQDKKYLELKVRHRKTAPMEVRLTDKGKAFAEGYWNGCLELGSKLLAGMAAEKLRSHLEVNYSIQRMIHGWTQLRSAAPQKVEPVQNLMSLFLTAKAISLAIERSVVLPEEGLSVERADLLVLLYLRDDFVSFGEIQHSLVHSFSPNRHLISRWIGEMGPQALGLIETRSLPGKRMSAAITPKGRSKVKPIWERYQKLADWLVTDIGQADRKAHLLVNSMIADVIRPRLDLLASEVESRKP